MSKAKLQDIATLHSFSEQTLGRRNSEISLVYRWSGWFENEGDGSGEVKSVGEVDFLVQLRQDATVASFRADAYHRSLLWI